MTPNTPAHTVTDTLREQISHDQRRVEELRARYPAWTVWNVPRADGHTTWHAQPRRYPLQCRSDTELETAILEAEAGPGDGPDGT